MQLVLDSVRTVAQHYPPWLRAELEVALPSVALEATRLALEVMQAERDGIPFSEAVRRIDLPLMGRVHFGLTDLLHHRMPAEFRSALRDLATAVKRGDFEGLGLALFAAASREGDPQAALLRFLLYEGARIELLIATWERPEFEALGVLGKIDREAQDVLSRRLAMREMHDGAVRPLHVLMAELELRAYGDAEAVALALRHSEEATMFVLQLVEATRTIRGLDAPKAAVARADAFEAEMDSQRLVDTYPWHFSTTNSVDQTRSRLRRAIERGEPPLVLDGSRFIDVLLAEMREGDDE